MRAQDDETDIVFVDVGADRLRDRRRELDGGRRLLDAPIDRGGTERPGRDGERPDASLPTRLAVGVARVVPGVGSSEEEAARRLVRLATDPTFGERTGVYVTEDGIVAPL